MARKKYITGRFLILIIQFIVLIQVQVSANGESEDDDDLISQLLHTPIGDGDDSEVSKILKVLEAAELASTTTTTTTTTPRPTTTISTTPKPSPFFNTESPLLYSSRKGKLDPGMDDVIPLLNKQFEEVSQWLDEDKKHTAERRSGKHYDPPVENLLLGTARAVWEVSRPVFFKTKAGRTISLINDLSRLPFRTLGAVKRHISGLAHGHHHYRDFHHHRGGWGKRHVHDHHPLDHGWGWEDPHVVYVKYEPENSLFKSWLRFLYTVVRPAVVNKIRMKRMFIFLKLRAILRLLRRVKIRKILTAIAAFRAKLRLLTRKTPPVVVLKEEHHDHHDHHGWGWGWQPPPTPIIVHKGWGDDLDGWKPGKPPAAATHPKPVYGPPPKPVYGPPKHSYSDAYGPVAKSSRGYPTYKNPGIAYGPPTPPTTKSPPPRVAYSPHNTYQNYQPPPSQYLVAPEPNAQASHHHPLEIEAPSYAQHLQQFGINPSTLSESEAAAEVDSSRYLRQSETESSKELDVPYIVSSNSTEEMRKRM